jgi:hypothetical protein
MGSEGGDFRKLVKIRKREKSIERESPCSMVSESLVSGISTAEVVNRAVVNWEIS